MACARAALLVLFLDLLVASLVDTASARCLAGDCPGSGAPSLLQVGGSRGRIGKGHLKHQRLHVLTVTGPGKYERFAIKAWEHQRTYLGPYDNFTHICEPGCGKLTVHGHSLSHVLPITDDAFPSGSCIAEKGEACSGYERSQMKWVWGLIHEWRARRSGGRPLPRWWLLKDDDTYVRADRLMDLVSGIDPMKERAIVGHRNERPFHTEGHRCWEIYPPAAWFGGTGLLLSAALVEALATKHAEQWLRLQEKQIRLGCPQYDHHIGTAVSWVSDVRDHVHLREFSRWGCVEHGKITGINETTVSYHMERVREAIGDKAALARVSERFSAF